MASGFWLNYWAPSRAPFCLIQSVWKGQFVRQPDLSGLANYATATHDLDNVDYTDLKLRTSYCTFRGRADGTSSANRLF